MSQIAPAQHITLGQFLKAHAVEERPAFSCNSG